jgi:HlyD family secretion protein
MKKKTWIYAGAAAIAAVALLAWAFTPSPIEVEAASVTQGRFETSISEDGTTRLRDYYRVHAPLAGRLDRITLREGNSVDDGTIVATLKPVLAPMQDQRTLREQQVRVELAEAQAQRADARVESARVLLQRAGNDLKRSEQLARQGFVAASKLESERLAALSAQKELETAAHERHIASHEVGLARAALLALSGSDREARSFPLRSPIAGRVLRVAQVSETTVAPGTLLMELGDMRKLEVAAEVLTAEAAQVRPGAAVLIDRWGGPTLEGRVRLIEPAAFTKISALGVEEQRVRVLIDITSPPAQWSALGDGYRVGVRIITMVRDNVVKVPASAVFPLPAQADGRKMAVFAIENGKANLRPVKLGARSENEAWIQEGLAAGATVIVYPPPAVKAGERVKIRKV